MHIWKSHVRANKLDVQEKDENFLLMQVYAWMEYQLLIFGIWLLKCFILHETNQRKPKIKYWEARRVTPHQTSTPKTNTRFQFITTIWNCVMFMMFHRTRSILNLVRCYTFSEDIEAVIKMIIKGRSPTMCHVSRTHRVALDWLFDRINLDPKIQIKYVDTKHNVQTY